MPHALIFDADGVVVIGERAGDVFARDHGITRAMTRPFFQGEFLECLIGKADLKQVLPPHLAAWGWTGTVDEYLDVWFTFERSVDENLLSEIDALRASGTPCYLATNQERHRTAYLRDQMELGSRFDGIFSSAAIGHRKPQHQFFAHITSTLGPSVPSDLIFFDDVPANVEGARAAGWQAHLYSNLQTLQTALEAL